MSAAACPNGAARRSRCSCTTSTAIGSTTASRTSSCCAQTATAIDTLRHTPGATDDRESPAGQRWTTEARSDLSRAPGHLPSPDLNAFEPRTTLRADVDERRLPGPGHAGRRSGDTGGPGGTGGPVTTVKTGLGISTLTPTRLCSLAPTTRIGPPRGATPGWRSQNAPDTRAPCASLVRDANRRPLVVRALRCHERMLHPARTDRRRRAV